MARTNQISLVLESRRGDLLRTLHWDAPSLYLIKGASGRLEARESLDLGQDDELIQAVDLENLSRRPLAVGDVGFIRQIRSEDQLKVVLSEDDFEDDEEKFKKSLKVSAISHASLLFLGFLVYFIQSFFQVEKPLVKIEVPQKVTIQAPKVVREKVKATTQKVKKNKVVAKRRSKVVAKRNVVKARPRKNQASAQNVSQMGALAAFGGSQGGKKSGRGLRLDSTLQATGSGNSLGTKSLGHASAAFAGKGLSAASGGGGTKNLGQVGYGTKGRSGGQAGYGQMNIGGSGAGGGYAPILQGGGSVDGGLEMSQIEAVIQQNIGQIYYCYEKGLQKQPQLKGRVVTDFVINGAGRVQVAQIGRSSLNSTQVERCMLGKLKSWKFPKPVGNVDVSVSYPFNLKRAH